jgi:hypothetical protein
MKPMKSFTVLPLRKRCSASALSMRLAAGEKVEGRWSSGIWGEASMIPKGSRKQEKQTEVAPLAAAEGSMRCRIAQRLYLLLLLLLLQENNLYRHSSRDSSWVCFCALSSATLHCAHSRAAVAVHTVTSEGRKAAA